MNSYFKIQIVHAMGFLLALVVACPASAGIVTIDFDDQPTGVLSSAAYSTFGVTFSNTTITNILGSDPAASSPRTIIATTSSVQPKVATPIVATFDAPTSFVSVLGLDVGANGIRIDAYDSMVGGAIIATDTFIGTSLGVGTNATLSLSSANILRVEFYQPFSVAGDGVVWDNFSFGTMTTQSVPEPTSFAIFGIGALGLAGGRRRRRRQ